MPKSCPCDNLSKSCVPANALCTSEKHLPVLRWSLVENHVDQSFFLAKQEDGVPHLCVLFVLAISVATIQKDRMNMCLSAHIVPFVGICFIFQIARLGSPIC